MNNKKIFLKNGSIFGCSDMKRSPSELALRELFASDDEKQIQQKSDIFNGSYDDFFDGAVFFPETPKGLSSCSSFTDNQFWPGNLNPKQSNFSTTMDSQSSISGVHNFTTFLQIQDSINSSTSANKHKGQDNQAAVASSGSSRELSDEDDLEMEAGSCKHSTNHIDPKRIKRMASNRDSARRSRRRKQAHLADLKQEVEKLNGEHDILSNKLRDVTQKLKDAGTNYRVLKSDVEALRAKVKLAEDMVARGSLTSSLSHLLQNYLNPPQTFMNNNISRMDNIAPAIAFHGDDSSLYPGLTDSTIGHQNAENFNGSVANGVTSDTVSCVSEIWSHVAPMSK